MFLIGMFLIKKTCSWIRLRSDWCVFIFRYVTIFVTVNTNTMIIGDIVLWIWNASNTGLEDGPLWIRIRPCPNGSIFLSVFHSTKNQRKNRAVWPPCWVSRMESSDVEWSLIFVKKSSKRTVVEWKLSRLATLLRKSSESMRSSVSLAGKYKWW